MKSHPNLRPPPLPQEVGQGVDRRSPTPMPTPSPTLPPIEAPKTDDHHDDDDHHQDDDTTLTQEHTGNSGGKGGTGAANANAAAGSAAHQLVLDKQGSGPTELGYVKDFAYERTRAFVPNATAAVLALQAHTAQVSKLADATLQSCTEVNRDTTTTTMAALCRDTDTLLYAYNRLNFSRTFCDVELPAQSLVKLDSVADHAACVSSSATTRHLLPHDIMPSNAQGMPPIQVVAHANGADTAHMQTVTCDVPCQFDVSLMFTTMSAEDNNHPNNGRAHVEPPKERFIQGEEGWKILHNGNIEKSHSIEKTDWKRNIFHSTVSHQSAIPVSTFDFAKYNYRDTHAVDWDTAERAAAYFAQYNCQPGSTRRHKWVNALQVVYPVHAYGACQHNTDDDSGADVSTMAGRLEVMRKHRLVLAYEASNEKDAFTELTWEAFLSGAVPVVVGPSNAVDVLPPHSFIWSGYFNNWDKFSEEVVRIADNKTAWESYQTWRSDPAALQALEDHFNFTRTSIECRTCRWAYAKMYSLRWDADQQQILPSTIPRDEFCVSKEAPAQMTKPFKEVWSGHEGWDPQEMDCQTKAMDHEGTLEMDGYKVTRQILHHDGVTDILVKELDATDTDESIVLRLEFDIKNHEGAHFPNVHAQEKEFQNYHQAMSSAAMQDFDSRVTVLADWDTTVSSPSQGVMEVALPSSLEETRRIRIILEDVDRVNSKSTEFFPFPLGKKMTQDFINPVELYYQATARR